MNETAQPRPVTEWAASKGPSTSPGATTKRSPAASSQSRAPAGTVPRASAEYTSMGKSWACAMVRPGVGAAWSIRHTATGSSPGRGASAKVGGPSMRVPMRTVSTAGSSH